MRGKTVAYFVRGAHITGWLVYAGFADSRQLVHILHSDTLEQWFMAIATEAWGAGKAWEGMPCRTRDGMLSVDQSLIC